MSGPAPGNVPVDAEDGSDETEQVGEAIAAFVMEEAPAHMEFEFEATDEAARLRVHVHESVAGLAVGGTGGWVWNSSVFLARWLYATASRRAALRDKTVLELGCGSSAIPSLMAAKLGASAVVASDLCEDCNQAAKENIRSENLSASIAVASLDIICPEEESLRGLGAPADVILFADLVYLEKLAAALPDTIALLLRRAPDPSAASCFGCIAERTLFGGTLCCPSTRPCPSTLPP